MGVTYGDICRQARKTLEGGEVNTNELKKEFGNIIASTVRWADDLGLDIEECLELALTAQRAYKHK